MKKYIDTVIGAGHLILYLIERMLKSQLQKKDLEKKLTSANNDGIFIFVADANEQNHFVEVDNDEQFIVISASRHSAKTLY
jgi:hypothetical protein